MTNVAERERAARPATIQSQPQPSSARRVAGGDCPLEHPRIEPAVGRLGRHVGGDQPLPDALAEGLVDAGGICSAGHAVGG